MSSSVFENSMNTKFITSFIMCILTYIPDPYPTKKKKAQNERKQSLDPRQSYSLSPYRSSKVWDISFTLGEWNGLLDGIAHHSKAVHGFILDIKDINEQHSPNSYQVSQGMLGGHGSPLASASSFERSTIYHTLKREDTHEQKSTSGNLFMNDTSRCITCYYYSTSTSSSS